ncbi:MAG TPA: hypothetical protein DCS07_16010 [Bdellovibrionales bacterium]|nr:hypothetical protein [Bdellovibrionales bacterium]
MSLPLPHDLPQWINFIESHLTHQLNQFGVRPGIPEPGGTQISHPMNFIQLPGIHDEANLCSIFGDDAFFLDLESQRRNGGQLPRDLS